MTERRTFDSFKEQIPQVIAALQRDEKYKLFSLADLIVALKIGKKDIHFADLTTCFADTLIVPRSAEEANVYDIKTTNHVYYSKGKTLGGHGAKLHCSKQDHDIMVQEIIELVTWLKSTPYMAECNFDVYNLHPLIPLQEYLLLFLDLTLQGKIHMNWSMIPCLSVDMCKNFKQNADNYYSKMSEVAKEVLNSFIESDGKIKLMTYAKEHNDFYCQ